MKGQMTLGITASILAAFLFTVMDVSAKVLAPLGMGEITFIRGLAGLLFIPLIAMHEEKPSFPAKTGFSFTFGAFSADSASFSFSTAFRDSSWGMRKFWCSFPLSSCASCLPFSYTPPVGKGAALAYYHCRRRRRGAAGVEFPGFQRVCPAGGDFFLLYRIGLYLYRQTHRKGRPLGRRNRFLFPNLFYDRRRPSHGRSYGNAFRRGLGVDFLHVPVCSFCSGGSDLGMHPYTAGDCDLCHVHRYPFPHSGGLVPLGRETDSVFLDRRGGYRFRKRHAAVEDKEELGVETIAVGSCIPEG